MAVKKKKEEKVAPVVRPELVTVALGDLRAEVTPRAFDKVWTHRGWTLVDDVSSDTADNGASEKENI